MPPQAHVLTLVRPWRSALKKFPVSFSLPDLHSFLFPESFLFSKAHRAGPDVQIPIEQANLLFHARCDTIARRTIRSYLDDSNIESRD